MKMKDNVQLYHYTFYPWAVEEGRRVVAGESSWKKFETLRPASRVLIGVDVFEDWKGREGEGEMCCRKTGEALSINARGHVWPMGWPSMSDGDDWGAETYTMGHVRRRLFGLIDATPHIDWLLVTKMPENVLRMWPSVFCSSCGKPATCFGTYEEITAYGCDDCCGHGCEDGFCEMIEKDARQNVQLLASVEDQAAANGRIEGLLKCRDLAPVLGLLCDPLLGQVDLSRWLWAFDPAASSELAAAVDTPRGELHWVIVGGESGHGARPCHLDWMRSIVRQCRDAGVACFVKQTGMSYYDNDRGTNTLVFPFDPKGGDWDEWPEDLRVREFPKVVMA